MADFYDSSLVLSSSGPFFSQDEVQRVLGGVLMGALVSIVSSGCHVSSFGGVQVVLADSF